MRIGINGSGQIALGQSSKVVVDHAVAAEADGFPTYWVPQIGVPDALTLLGVVGQATSTIELGTAVIATWPRHPLMLAMQALTTSEIAGGRIILGIGLAHKTTVEETFKIPFARPAKNMEEYLDVLLPTLQDRKVDVTGDLWSAVTESVGGPPDIPTPSVMLAAMGPRMLELAGARTDGNILWLSGPRTIETLIGPAMRSAAEQAGRPAPRIVASVPVCVTDNRDGVRELVAGILANYNDLPSYRGVMDLEGAAGPEDVSLIGDEDEVRAGIERFGEAGTTDFSALEFVTNPEDATRTRAFLTSLLPTS